MIPVELAGNEVRQLVSEDTGRSLAVITARGLVFSCWRPSPEDLAQLQAGKPVWVVIRGSIVPEFHLTVGDRRTVIPPDIISAAKRSKLVSEDPGVKRAIAEDESSKRRVERLVDVIAYAYMAMLFGALIAVSVAAWRMLVR